MSELEVVGPHPVANDTFCGVLRVTLASRDHEAQVTLVFRSFEELAESRIIERLQDGASMMFGLGIWKRPEMKEKR